MLDDQSITRYQGQINLPSIDLLGQENICKAKVLILGLGGLGCSVATALVGSGVGQVTLVDDDVVNLANLPRQTLYRESDIGAAKTLCAKRILTQINNACLILTFEERLQEEALLDECVKHDLVLDCTDNLASRLLLNRVSILTSTPWVMGAAIRQEGQYAIFDPNRGKACYACFMGEQTDKRLSCSESGVLGPVVGMVGQAQALLALQYLTRPEHIPYSTLFYLDGEQHQLMPLSISPKQNCQCQKVYAATD